MATVLVVGGGAREQVLAEAYEKSANVVCVSPGNAGISLMKKTVRLGLKEIDEIVDFAKMNPIDLIDVGPEGYLTKGIVDKLHNIGKYNVVGQKAEAGILETDKCWAKDFWKRHNIPVPEFANFSDPNKAKEYIRNFYRENPDENVVAKVAEICAGKGSIPCENEDQALRVVDRIMIDREFDNKEKGISAGNKIVVEKRLYGLEIMLFVATDGKTISFLGTAKDSKKAFDYTLVDRKYISKYFNGINPNTGGMICISPHPKEDEFKDEIMKKIAVPTLRKFQEETGHEYIGIGYFGIMLSEENGDVVPRILEFNRRHGDPEASAIVPRLKTDYYELASAIVERRLHEVPIEFDPHSTYVLVAVSGGWIPAAGEEDDRGEYPGYPGNHHTNQPIRGLRRVDSSVRVYHSGTEFRNDPNKRDEDNNLATTGGRVLELVAFGNGWKEAKSKAEAEMRKIFFKGKRCRRTPIEPEAELRPKFRPKLE
ncbi:MAG: phosphoribosylamine--glycine ligase [Promethearchaeota archaeon]